jgi:predicted helicase
VWSPLFRIIASFDDLPFDGLRKHLRQDFDDIYVLDLGGNVRRNPKLSGTTHNVFGIQVGVSVSILARYGKTTHRVGTIHYKRLDEFWRRSQKYAYLDEHNLRDDIKWTDVQPDSNHNWLLLESKDDFQALIPLATKAAKQSPNTVFNVSSPGAQTNRDDWMYNFDNDVLIANVERFIGTYNEEVRKWSSQKRGRDKVDSFVLDDDRRIKWSSSLKAKLLAKTLLTFKLEHLRESYYRPFTVENLYFDEALTHRRGQFPRIFPDEAKEAENRVVAITGHSQIPFSALCVNRIPSLDFGGRAGQCLPFYTYNEDGTNRRENITDWALEQFRTHYKDKSITKWDIFHYVYALLHHPLYRERYAANLKRELPRIPFTPDFRAFADIGNSPKSTSTMNSSRNIRSNELRSRARSSIGASSG